MGRLSNKNIILLDKSRNSALLAIQVYNNPNSYFRVYTYITLMCIAWLSLFHAIFEKQKINYFYKKIGSNRYEYVDDEKKAWDLSRCLSEYYKNNNSPVRDNLRLYIGIRNKIEHKYLPELSELLMGENQALLLNYETMLVKEFGEKYSLSDSLYFPLQITSILPEWSIKAKKRAQSKEYVALRDFVWVYRNSLSEDSFDSLEYSFKVFLIPKIANNERNSDIAMEFVKLDKLNPSDLEKYTKAVTFIKDRKIEVSNLDKYKPSEVCNVVQDILGIPFHHSTHHVKCWKYYKVRPEKRSANPYDTRVEFCCYDEVHGDYVYTKRWIDFLITELRDENRRTEIFSNNK